MDERANGDAGSQPPRRDDDDDDDDVQKSSSIVAVCSTPTLTLFVRPALSFRPVRAVEDRKYCGSIESVATKKFRQTPTRKAS